MSISARTSFAFLMAMLLLSLPIVAEDVHLDLSNLIDRDGFVPDGQGSGDPLSEDGDWLDAASLPSDYTDGSPYPTRDGFTTFLYGPLSGDSPDCCRVDGQEIGVPAGEYGQLHLALVSPDTTLMDLSREITLNYQDGTSEMVTLGPFADWYGTPARFFDAAFSWVDDSAVEEHLSIRTKENDYDYIIESTGSTTSDAFDFTFVDATSVLIYEFDLEDSLTDATLAIDMQNNFVVSISTDFGGTFTEVLNSMELFGEDIHSGSNRDVYEVDLAPFLEQMPENILWIQFTDGSTADGWGPAIWTVEVYSGETVRYEGEPLTEIDTSNATVYADFRTDGSDDEAQYLVDDQSNAPTAANHRFADGGGFITYGFDLPDDISEAKASVNMEANFVVSVATERNLTTHIDFIAGGEDEEYIWEQQGSVGRPTDRFVDAAGYLIYWLDLPDDLTAARLDIDMQNNFLVSVGKDVYPENLVLDSMAMFGEDIHNGSNRSVYTVDLAPYLEDNATNEVFVMFEDGSTADGWGPDIFRVSVKSGSEGEYSEVLNAMDVTADAPVPFTGSNTGNKKYYTIDLSPFLENNSSNEVFVKFTDGTPENGYGPGLFRMLVYSGEIVPQIDGLAMEGIMTTSGLPDNAYPWGANFMRRAYPVNPVKTLQSIVLPEIRDEWDIFLFAATLQGEGTGVTDWSVY